MLLLELVVTIETNRNGILPDELAMVGSDISGGGDIESQGNDGNSDQRRDWDGSGNR